MQNMPITNNQEVMKEDGKDSYLRELPIELAQKGIIPENVWISLTPEHKQDILRQAGLYEKYVNPQPAEAAIPAPVQVEAPAPEAQPGIEVMENIRPVESEITKLSEQVKENERQFVENEGRQNETIQLNQDEKQRIAEETAQGSNTMSAPKLFGYHVNSNTVQDANDLSENGNIEDGSTWAATLIKKIFAIFGE